MARSIAANTPEAWRVALVFDEVGPGGAAKRVTEYDGIYTSRAVCKGRITYWRNWTEYKVKSERNHGRFLVDAWIERTELDWVRTDV